MSHCTYSAGSAPKLWSSENVVIGLRSLIPGSMADNTTYEVNVTRVPGDLVVFTAPAFTATIAVAPSEITSINALPACYRPASAIRTPLITVGDCVWELWIQANGTVTFSELNTSLVTGLSTYDNAIAIGGPYTTCQTSLVYKL